MNLEELTAKQRIKRLPSVARKGLEQVDSDDVPAVSSPK